jgi:uronate dehydrogenase
VPTILITGAAGQVGAIIRPRLAGPGRVLRLLDVAPLAQPPGLGEEAVTASVTDMAAMTAACAGADAVIHLGGIPGEDAWARILDVNVNGTYTVFEAARRAGVPRVVFASSNHAVGFTPRESFPVPDGAAPAPDTYYGVSKAAGEAIAALYARRYGLEAICVRILSCTERPRDPRMLATWLSPDDAGRLFEACLTAPAPGFRVIYGVSANTRGGWVSLDGAHALGYESRDDAETYAAEILGTGEPDGTGPDGAGTAPRGAQAAWPDPSDPLFRYLGGEFTFASKDAPVPDTAD